MKKYLFYNDGLKLWHNFSSAFLDLTSGINGLQQFIEITNPNYKILNQLSQDVPYCSFDELNNRGIVTGIIEETKATIIINIDKLKEHEGMLISMSLFDILNWSDDDKKNINIIEYYYCLTPNGVKYPVSEGSILIKNGLDNLQRNILVWNTATNAAFYPSYLSSSGDKVYFYDVEATQNYGTELIMTTFLVQPHFYPKGYINNQSIHSLVLHSTANFYGYDRRNEKWNFKIVDGQNNPWTLDSRLNGEIKYVDGQHGVYNIEDLFIDAVETWGEQKIDYSKVPFYNINIESETNNKIFFHLW